MKKSLLIFLSLLSVLALASCKNQKEPVPPEELCLDIQKIQMDMEYSALKEFYDPEPFEVLKADDMVSQKSICKKQEKNSVRACPVVTTMIFVHRL